MIKKIVCIRGATKVLNTQESVIEQVCSLCNLIIIKNKLTQNNIINVFFTVTNDVTKMNPATALRKGNTKIDFSNIPLFCMAEPNIENSTPLVIRVMFTTYFSLFKKTKSIYINGAEILRPDLFTK